MGGSLNISPWIAGDSCPHELVRSFVAAKDHHNSPDYRPCSQTLCKQEGWYLPGMLPFTGKKEEHQKIKVILSYTASLWPSWAT